jgi:hypothetical protein
MSQRRPLLFPLGLKRSEMSKRPSQPWSSEDEARLRALAAAGRSTATIAERLKASSSCDPLQGYEAQHSDTTRPR